MLIPFKVFSKEAAPLYHSDSAEKLSKTLLKVYLNLLRNYEVDTVIKMEFLLLPYLKNYCIWLLQQEMVVEYLKSGRIETFILNKQNLDDFNENLLEELFISLTNESFEKIYSLFCNHFLRGM